VRRTRARARALVGAAAAAAPPSRPARRRRRLTHGSSFPALAAHLLAAVSERPCRSGRPRGPGGPRDVGRHRSQHVPSWVAAPRSRPVLSKMICAPELRAVGASGYRPPAARRRGRPERGRELWAGRAGPRSTKKVARGVGLSRVSSVSLAPRAPLRLRRLRACQEPRSEAAPEEDALRLHLKCGGGRAGPLANNLSGGAERGKEGRRVLRRKWGVGGGGPQGRRRAREKRESKDGNK